MRRRVLSLFALAVVLTAVSATPTSANTLFPAGCETHGLANWDGYCWLGANGSLYVNSANYVTGAQRVISGSTSVGPIDGLYGPQTAAAMMTFQQQQGIGVDGIVGSQTWSTLMGRMVATHFDPDFTYYSPVGVPGPVFARRVGPPFDWWVVAANSGIFVRMSVGGPD